MADTIDPKKDNKDAESGAPVQLDEEQQGGEQAESPQLAQSRPPQPQPGGQQAGGGLKR